MTRKDYVLIAAAVRRIHDDSDTAVQPTARRIAYALAFALQGTNPRFDMGRFVTAAVGE